MIDLNPSDMKEIFERSVSNKRPVRNNYKMNLVTPKTNQVRHGTNSLRSLAAKMWNSLLASIKSSENLEFFKNLTQVWDGTSCKCYICSKWLPVLFVCGSVWKMVNTWPKKFLCYPLSKIGVFDFLISWIFRKKSKK